MNPHIVAEGQHPTFANNQVMVTDGAGAQWVWVEVSLDPFNAHLTQSLQESMDRWISFEVANREGILVPVGLVAALNVLVYRCNVAKTIPDAPNKLSARKHAA